MIVLACASWFVFAGGIIVGAFLGAMAMCLAAMARDDE